MYNFDQPVTENIRLKGRWDCTKPLFIFRQTAGSGSISIRNPFNATLRAVFKGVSQNITVNGSGTFTFNPGENAELEIYGAYSSRDISWAGRAWRAFCTPYSGADIE